MSSADAALDTDAAQARPPLERWLAEARAGSPAGLSRLLEECRGYLLGIANQELDPQLRGKAGASDMVQETFLRAQREFEQFDGQTEQEWLGWLRQILVHQLANLNRHYCGTSKRNIQRELPLNDAPGQHGEGDLVDPGDTPSAIARTKEDDDRLRAALKQLKPKYRQVIEWRNYEGLSLEEIGQRLGKSAEAARKLWARAVDQLGQRLETPDASSPP